jgi:hypothetical protein
MFQMLRETLLTALYLTTCFRARDEESDLRYLITVIGNSVDLPVARLPAWSSAITFMM